MGRKKNLKKHVTQKQTSKKSQGVWKGGKRAHYDYEGTQYTGGRKKGTPNLKKLSDGTLKNQYGVVFTPEEKKMLESAVNTANRKRMKMLEEEGSLPRLVGGVDTGQKVSSLQAMGKESDFILARKHKSLQRFKTKEDFEYYLENVRKVVKPEYLEERTRLYKRNHMKAIENVFGDDAKDVLMKIRMMKPDEYRRLLQSDEMLEVSYVYDPSARAGKLNQIRASLGMKLKEEDVDGLMPEEFT